MPRELIFLAGAGEPITTAMLPYTLCSPWIREDDVITLLDYGNSIGPVNNTPNPVDLMPGLNDSVAAAESALADHVAATSYVPYVISYSLGAYGHSNFLEKKAKGQYKNLEIAGNLLVGSPRAYPRIGREGIAGAHGRYPKDCGPILELNNWEDIIASTPHNSLLRKLPGFVGLFTTDVMDLWETNWWHYFLEIVLRNNTWLTLNDIKLVVKYLNGTGHASEYFDISVLRQYPARLLA